MSLALQVKACCTRPPIVLRGGYDYKEQGKYVDFNGMKTYVTGSPTATRAIFLCYDVFGLWVQSIKGADILASGNSETADTAGDFIVFMPDFWGDNPQDLNIFPPKTPEQRQKVFNFMTGPANPQTVLPSIAPLHEAYQKAYPHITSWGTVGFCWGIKMNALMCQSGTKFKAAAGCHPSLMDVEDAKKVVVPTCVLPSQDENPELVDAWFGAIKANNPDSYLETFGDQVHGWATSRADFNNLHNYEEYIRAYRIMRTFLNTHM